ncbi:hypothetical protein ACHAWU_007755 [Discostella pseudostelligera]|uniref:Uncharacterized protein n=1 Tax=Discostella pseudostelligera TaxID=259834 RepID=A0ABD3N8H2_9STRA
MPHWPLVELEQQAEEEGTGLSGPVVPVPLPLCCCFCTFVLRFAAEAAR